MAKVSKRRLPSGEVRWQFGYRDRDGKRRFKMFERKADADAYAIEVGGQLKAGIHTAPAKSITVQTAGELWLAWAGREGLEVGTVRQYRQHLQLHIAPLIGSKRLCDLTAADVAAFRNALLDTRSRALSRAILTSLKGIIREAQIDGKVGHNVAAAVQISRKKRGPDGAKAMAVKDLLDKVFTKDRIRMIVTKSAELWPEFKKIERTRKREEKIVAVCWRPFILTALFSGMRCSELRGLTWDHVNLEVGLIQVRQRADFQATMGAPKTEESVRDIPMTPMVLNTLRQWKLACPATPARLVFPTENGRVHSNTNIHKQCWRPMLHAIGLVDVTRDEGGKRREKPLATFHHLRHVAASLLIEQGWLPKKVQMVMGHSSITVTYDTYGKLFPDAQSDQNAMAEMETRLLRPVG
ncbi:MAG TPA: tyrosine-type recombinase/integrase [Rhizomicrobium sp.]|jgi:integrase|nr:tyrosine-type recombinase/integrase [Rhizomicrobium sp.]